MTGATNWRDDDLPLALTQLTELIRDTYGEDVNDIWAAIEHYAQQSQVTTE